MKTLVLDTTELRRDWTLNGLTMRLLAYACREQFLDVCVPEVALEELIAHHGRAVEDALDGWRKANRTLRQLGLQPPGDEPSGPDYRGYLVDRLLEHLGFALLPLPDTPHSELIARAVQRVPPFNAKGTGYRDSLVWASVLQLVGAGNDVVLVSADRAFGDGALVETLANEVSRMGRRVDLVHDLTPWLLRNLPWRAESLASALALARDEEFARYFLDSDADGLFYPEPEVIGFDQAPYRFEVTDVEWSGSFERVATRRGEDGVSVAEYDVTERVRFEASLPATAIIDPDWESAPDRDRQDVTGSVALIVRFVVLFDDEFGLQIEDLSWRRADGMRGGPGVLATDNDIPLFDDVTELDA